MRTAASAGTTATVKSAAARTAVMRRRIFGDARDHYVFSDKRVLSVDQIQFRVLSERIGRAVYFLLVRAPHAQYRDAACQQADKQRHKHGADRKMRLILGHIRAIIMRRLIFGRIVPFILVIVLNRLMTFCMQERKVLMVG